MDVAKIFESIMLLCFGLAWPLSIARMVRTKRADGKSRWFLLVIMFGYASGICYKITGRYDAVIYLYMLNLMLVGIDLLLCLKYQKAES
jgi:hypothetical protein